jgi:Family of unknown function (DUF6476)
VTSLAQKSQNEQPDNPAVAPGADQPAALAKVRLLMLISALTTAVAIAAVLGVIGYRVYAASESGAGAITNGTVFLPKGAHVVSTTIGDGRIVVTLDIGGQSEVRIYDLKTLRQTGRLQFATEH